MLASPATTGTAVACPSGEQEDVYTGVCVPHTVPNSPGRSMIGAIPGNPNIPAVSVPGGGGAIPCTGANTGECIGLAEENQAMGPRAEAHSSVDSSPTATGHIG